MSELDRVVVPGEGEHDYAARYTAGKTEFYVPARLPGEVSGHSFGATCVSLLELAAARGA
jgi:hypothetical protein